MPVFAGLGGCYSVVMRSLGALLVLAAVMAACGEPARSLAPPAVVTHTAAPVPTARPTARPTLPPVTDEQLEAFSRDGTYPPGWGDTEWTRLAFGQVWLPWRFGGSDCIMPAPGEAVPDCMLPD